MREEEKSVRGACVQSASVGEGRSGNLPKRYVRAAQGGRSKHIKREEVTWRINPRPLWPKLQVLKRVRSLA
eukprot:4918690-Amphidinium_carterae.1